MMARLFSGLC